MNTQSQQRARLLGEHTQMRTLLQRIGNAMASGQAHEVFRLEDDVWRVLSDIEDVNDGQPLKEQA